jgi:hypothetical protein
VLTFFAYYVPQLWENSRCYPTCRKTLAHFHLNLCYPAILREKTNYYLTTCPMCVSASATGPWKSFSALAASGNSEACARLVADGERVLAHCGMGLNRSALVAGLVLTYLGMKGEDAVALLRGKRPGALFNEDLAAYLGALPPHPTAPGLD